MSGRSFSLLEFFSSKPEITLKQLRGILEKQDEDDEELKKVKKEKEEEIDEFRREMKRIRDSKTPAQWDAEDIQSRMEAIEEMRKITGPRKKFGSYDDSKRPQRKDGLIHFDTGKPYSRIRHPWGIWEKLSPELEAYEVQKKTWPDESYHPDLIADQFREMHYTLGKLKRAKKFWSLPDDDTRLSKAELYRGSITIEDQSIFCKILNRFYYKQNWSKDPGKILIFIHDGMFIYTNPKDWSTGIPLYKYGEKYCLPLTPSRFNFCDVILWDLNYSPPEDDEPDTRGQFEEGEFDGGHGTLLIIVKSTRTIHILDTSGILEGYVTHPDWHIARLNEEMSELWNHRVPTIMTLVEAGIFQPTLTPDSKIDGVILDPSWKFDVFPVNHIQNEHEDIAPNSCITTVLWWMLYYAIFPSKAIKGIIPEPVPMWNYEAFKMYIKKCIEKKEIIEAPFKKPGKTELSLFNQTGGKKIKNLY